MTPLNDSLTGLHLDPDDPSVQELLKLTEQLNHIDSGDKYHLTFWEPYHDGDDASFMRPYDWQREFHNASDVCPERALICANRVGKSMSGAREMVAHLTGDYPPWWEGRRFNHPIRAWVGSDTNETSREIVQQALIGDEEGTGWLPRDAIIKVKERQAGISGVVDYVLVRHKSGGVSRLVFKTYEQGRKKWQGTSQHVIWFDEEPPADIWTEGLARTLDVQGLTYMTFTPLEGVSNVVLHYVDGRMEDGIWCSTVGWDQAPHLDEAEKQRMLMSFPVHEREARTQGVPLAGSGIVYRVPDEQIMCTPFDIPPHFARIAGVDFGIDHPFAAAWGAWDRDNDVVYIYDTYKQAGETMSYHRAAIEARGKDIPIAWPHDGMHREKSSGQNLADQCKAMGLNMLPMSSRYEDDKGGAVAKEPIVHEIDDRMRTGKFKVFENQDQFFREKRMYHRKDGVIVPKFDDVISAVHYAVMMKRFGRTLVKRRLPDYTDQYDPFDVLRG